MIKIKLHHRTPTTYITTIEGLNDDNFKTERIMRYMGHIFKCDGMLVYENKYIKLLGNQVEKARKFLIKKLKINTGDIIIQFK